MKKINPILDEAEKISRPWEDRKSISDVLEFVGDANFVLLGEMSHGRSRLAGRLAGKPLHQEQITGFYC